VIDNYLRTILSSFIFVFFTFYFQNNMSVLSQIDNSNRLERLLVINIITKIQVMFHHILSQTCLKPYIQDQLHIELCMNIFELVIQTKTTYKNIGVNLSLAIICTY
jgi:hypothetical protein